MIAVRKDDEFDTKFVFIPHDHIVSLNRERSGPNVPDVDAWRQSRRVACDFTKGSVKVGLFIDSGSVELFLDDGTATMSALITAPLSARRLQLSASNARVKVSGVTVSPAR